MQRLIFLLFIFTLKYSTLLAEIGSDFGNVGKQELTMKAYDKDGGAPAVILFDKGTLTFNSTYGFTYIFHKRTKIFTREGFDQGNITIYLPPEHIATHVQAASFNYEGGKIIKTDVPPDLVFLEKQKGYSLKKFTIPNIKQGSVIEVYYEISTSSGAIVLFPWHFQSTIPVVHSKLRFSNVPGNFGYQINSTFKLSAFEKDPSTGNYIWAADSIPAFKEEDFMECRDDHIFKIEFFSNPPTNIEEGWRTLALGLTNKNGFFLSDKVDFLDKYSFLAEVDNDSVAQVKRIFAFIRDSIRIDREKSNLDCLPLKKVFENRKGSAAEKNLLLAGALKKYGYSAFPVMTSSRSSGRITPKDYPSKHNFNKLLCLVILNGKKLYLDASEKLNSFGLIDPSTISAFGFVIKKGNLTWEEISTDQRYSNNYTLVLRLSPDGTIKGNVRIMSSGFAAAEIRKALESEGEGKYYGRLKETFSFARLDSMRVEGVNDVERNVVTKFSVEFEDKIPTNNGRILMSSHFIKFISKNPFSNEERNYPLDFQFGKEERMHISIMLSDKFRVESLPKNVNYALDDNSAGYLYKISDYTNAVQISTKLYLNKVYYPSDEYQSFKDLYDKVMKQQSEWIVLKNER